MQFRALPLLLVCTPFAASQEPVQAPWLQPLLERLPASTCAVAALGMPAEAFLGALQKRLRPDQRQVFDDLVRRTGQYKALAEVAEKLAPCLQDCVAVVIRAKPAVGDPQIPVAAPSPIPELAIVFGMRQKMDAPVRELVEVMKQYSQTFGFTHVYQLNLGSGKLVTEFTNPHIPGTGQLAAVVTDEWFVFANSGHLIRDMLVSRGPRMAAELGEVSRDDPGAGRGVLVVQARALQRVLADYSKHLATSDAADGALRSRFELARKLLDAAGPAQLRLAFDLEKIEEMLDLLGDG